MTAFKPMTRALVQMGARPIQCGDCRYAGCTKDKIDYCGLHHISTASELRACRDWAPIEPNHLRVRIVS